MRWDGTLATSVAKYLNIPVLCSITDTYTGERIDVLHVEKFLADDGIWKGTSTRVNMGAQQIGFLRDRRAQVLDLPVEVQDLPLV
jgi:nuclear transport factor 2 (NTF2) superfamily protein